MNKFIIDSCDTQVRVKGTHEVWKKGTPHYLDFKYFIKDGVEADKIGLITLTKVTHGFRLTENGMIYLPSELKAALPTISDPYPIPIKPKHKDTFTDKSGRTVETKDLTPIGRGYVGKWINNKNISNTVLSSYKDRIENLTVEDSDTLSVINSIVKNPKKIDRNFEGAGWVLVKGLVTDTESVEKILDKRFLTVSVEMKFEDLFDSITGKSFISDAEDLEWTMGDIVDGVRSIGIPTGLKFTGYAFTTHPADSKAGIHTMEKIEKNDIEKLISNYSESITISDSFCIEKSFDITDSEVEDFQLDLKPTENEMNMVIDDETKASLKLTIQDTIKEVLGDITLSLSKKDESILSLEDSKKALEADVEAKASKIQEVEDALKTMTAEKEVLSNLCSRLENDMKPYLSKLKQEVPVAELMTMNLEDSTKAILSAVDGLITNKLVEAITSGTVSGTASTLTTEDSEADKDAAKLGKAIDKQEVNNTIMDSDTKTADITLIPGSIEEKREKNRKKYEELVLRDKTLAVKFYNDKRRLGQI